MHSAVNWQYSVASLLTALLLLITLLHIYWCVGYGSDTLYFFKHFKNWSIFDEAMTNLSVLLFTFLDNPVESTFNLE